MPPLTRRALFDLLEERLRDPSIAEAQDLAIWERAGIERAILVLDMSGFTRLTRRHGILHFLAVFSRACGIAAEAIRGAHGLHVKSEADNVIATFSTVRDALAAARAIHAGSMALDARLAEDERVMACIALGYGRFLELADDVFGDEVNVTFKLGEDIARPREILLSQAAAARLPVEGLTLSLDERATTAGGVALRYYAVVGGA